MSVCRTFLEINTRLWLRELGNGPPLSLADVPDEHFDLWKTRAVDAVWLMGVWKPSAASRDIARVHTGLTKDYSEVLPDWTPEDVTASPYALVGYEVNPELGGEAGLAEFRRKLNERGMKLILDFVPSHTARDHPWTRTHPERYVQGNDADHGIDRPSQQIAIQAALDVASHIVSDERLGEPRTNQALFDLLATGGWVPPETALAMRRAVGFRNVVVHGYASVDVDVVRDVVEHHLQDLLDFAEAIRLRLSAP